MEFKLTLPDGTLIEFKREPMSWDRFQALCRLAGFGLYIVLTHVVAETGDFFALLWFFGLTLTMAGIWAWKD